MAAPDVRPGDVLTAEMVRDLYSRTEPPRVRGSGGISVRQGRRGQVQLAAPIPRRVSDGQTSTTISGRSGTTLGSGQVDLYDFDGTDLVATGETVTAYTFASSGFGSGKYCWVEEDERGYWRIVSIEC